MTQRLGIFAWYGYQAPIEERLKAIAEAGFDATCLWLGEEEETVRAGKPGVMVEAARKLDLYIDNVHAELNNCNYIWSEKADERRYISKEYKKGLHFCAEHDIPALVVHICSSSTPPRMNQNGLDLIGDLVEEANKQEVMLAIENTRRQEYLDQVFSTFNSKYLGLCYDSGHDFLWGIPDFEILKKWGKLLTTVHLADNAGQQDDHWIPWEGKLDWPEVMNTLSREKYEGTLLLEVYPKTSEVKTQPAFLSQAYSTALKLKEIFARLSNPPVKNSP
jgi:sugar phosphate isomerase/epimerase